MKTLSIILFALFIGASSCKKSGSSNEEENLTEAELTTKTVASGLSHVWEMVYYDDAIWYTERGGKVSKLDLETGDNRLLVNITDVDARGEGGLLGMTIHPNFSANPYVYVVYNYNRSGTYSQKVVRYTYDNNALTSPQILLDQIPAGNIHNGSRLVISSDLKLFISTGDAGDQNLAQNLNSLAGKILRINLDGTIPSDNPFTNSAIWTLGHRNPQGLAFGNGKLYSSEHGPSSDDEINIIEKGRNYGWPNVNGFCDQGNESSFCNTNNVREPLKVWTPTIAPAGLAYYNNNLIPQWKNSLILAVLKGQRIINMKLSEDGNSITSVQDDFTENGRLRAICVAPNGKVYIGSSNGSNDRIIEVDRSN